MEYRKVAVVEVAAKNRVRKDSGDLLPLTSSIGRVGLLHPIVLNSKMELIAGGRRLEAVKKLGWADVPAIIVNHLDDAAKALTAERDENTCRKSLTMTEMTELGARLEELERPAAEGRRGQRNDLNKHSGKFPPSSSGKTRDKVGKALGVSGKTYEKAKAIAETAIPALVAMVDDEQISIEAASEIAKLSKTEQSKIVAGGSDAVKKAAKKAKAEKKPKPTATPKAKPAPESEPDASEPADELDSLLKQILKLVKKNKELAKPAAEELLSLADEVTFLVPPLKRGESRPIYPKVPFGHFHINGTYNGPILKASDVGGEVVIDAYGHPVKPGLGDDFADPRYLNVALLLRRGLDAFTDADKIYQKLSARPKGVPTFPTDDWNKITKGIVAVSNGLADWTNTACPFVQCRKCHGKGCEDCSGTGYWGKSTAALYPTLAQDIRPKTSKAGDAA